jgi:LPXTG-motif cell wall-anchored protein
MAYATVFDTASTGYKPLWFVLVGAVFIGLSVLLIRFRRASPKWRERSTVARVIYPYGLLFFSVIWTIGAFIRGYQEIGTALEAANTGTAQIVEGPVTNFVPAPATGHANESFCVSNACFSYSDYVVTPGFNQTSSHGGPIHEGLNVRITYVGNTILKLEVSKDR